MTRYFKYPFAASGDKETVPDETAGTAVSYSTGYTPDYELAKDNPSRRNIDRQPYNGVLNDVTGNLKQIQDYGYPEFVPDNGTGSPLSYQIGRVVWYVDTYYRALVLTNTAPPSAQWAVVTDLRAAASISYDNATSGLSANDPQAAIDEVNSLVLDRVIRVTSIAAMEAYSAPVGYVFSLNAGGRSGVFDVIAGDFSTELTADTLNGIYVGLSDNATATTKVAKRRIDGIAVTPEMFGAIGDNIADDGVALQACIENTKSLFVEWPAYTYMSSQTITIALGKRNIKASPIRYTGTSTALIIENPEQNSVFYGLEVFRDVTILGSVLSDELLYEGIRFKNCFTSTFYDTKARGFRSGLVFGDGFTSSYCTFFNTVLQNNLIGVNIYGEINSFYFNENKFLGGRIVVAHSPAASDYSGTVYIKIESLGGGAYVPGWASNNEFLMFTMESIAVERRVICNASENSFLECYWEGDAGTTDIEVSGDGNVFQGKDLSFRVVSDTGASNSYLDALLSKPGWHSGEKTRLVTYTGAEINIASDNTVFVDSSGGDITLRVGVASGFFSGLSRFYRIKKFSTDSNTITFVSSGASSKFFQFEAPGSEAVIMSDGTDFRVVSGDIGSKVYSLTPGSIPAGEVYSELLSFPQAINTPSLDVRRGYRFDVYSGRLGGLIIAVEPVFSSQVRISIYNPTAAAIDPGTDNFYVFMKA